ncbi:LacI family DNA-binding transcriptional regulator [Streptomyces sp. NPDC005151]
MTRVRLVDVARAAEVSPATVSNALNGTGKMTDRTRAWVRFVAASMNYPPSSAVQRGKSRMLALGATTHPDRIWNYAAIPYYAQAIAAATAAAHAHGFGLTLVPALADNAGWRHLEADGVLLLDSPRHDPVADALAESGLPLAFDGRPNRAGRTHYWVDNDHAATTRSILDHLSHAGARRISLLSGTRTDAHTLQSEAAYLQWCAWHRQPPLIAPADDPREGLAAAEALLRRPPRKRPDAVYGLYSFCGRTTLAAARTLGLRVPEDLLVASTGEEPGDATAGSAVTTISLGPRTSARLAVDALVSHIRRGTPRPPGLVPAVLRIRDSTRPPHPLGHRR